MTLPPISGHRGLYGLRRRPQKETTTRMRIQRAETAFAVDGPLPRWNYFTTLALPTCDFNRNYRAWRFAQVTLIASRTEPLAPASSTQENSSSPLSSATVWNCRNGLAAMPGDISARNTSTPL